MPYKYLKLNILRPELVRQIVSPQQPFPHVYFPINGAPLILLKSFLNQTSSLPILSKAFKLRTLPNLTLITKLA